MNETELRKALLKLLKEDKPKPKKSNYSEWVLVFLFWFIIGLVFIMLF